MGAPHLALPVVSEQEESHHHGYQRQNAETYTEPNDGAARHSRAATAVV